MHPPVPEGVEMSLLEFVRRVRRPSTAPDVSRTRIRHQATDTLAAAGFSFAASVSLAATLWLVLRWLA